MCDLFDLLRRLRIAINTLEETVNLVEEAIDQFNLPPPQAAVWSSLIDLWRDHAASFRTNLRQYNRLADEPQTPENITQVCGALSSYGIEVSQYVRAVQDLCCELFNEAGESYPANLVESSRDIELLAQLFLADDRLESLRQLIHTAQQGILEFELFVTILEIKISVPGLRITEDRVDLYQQLVARLQENIALWQQELHGLEQRLDSGISNPVELDETQSDILSFLQKLNGCIELVRTLLQELLED